jgi:hypothetical protein
MIGLVLSFNLDADLQIAHLQGESSPVVLYQASSSNTFPKSLKLPLTVPAGITAPL